MPPSLMKRMIPEVLNTTVLPTPLLSILPEEHRKLEGYVKDKFFYNRPTKETIKNAEDRLDEERPWPKEDECKRRALRFADKTLEPALTHKAWTNEQVYDHADMKKRPGAQFNWMGYKTRLELVKSKLWIDFILGNINALQMLDMVYISTPKEEWASWEDLANLKARTFQISGYHVLHYQLLCFGEGNEGIKNTLWSKYGFNPFMGGTTRFGKSFMIVGKNGKLRFPWRIAWDISGYDRKVDLRNVARRRLKFFKVLNVDPELVTIAEWIAFGMTYSYVVLSNGDVVIRQRGNNSGSGMTTANNIEAGIEIMADILIYVYYKRNGYYPTDDELAEQLAALYGDDNLTCVSEEFSWICDKELVCDRLLNYHGLKVKEFVGGFEYSWDQLPFLGFTFDFKDNGTVLPRWNLTRLILPLVYTYRRNHPIEVYLQQFYSILLLSFDHEEWEMIRNIYVQVLRNIDGDLGSPVVKAMLRRGAPTRNQLTMWYNGWEGVSEGGGPKISCEMANQGDNPSVKAVAKAKMALLRTCKNDLNNKRKKNNTTRIVGGVNEISVDFGKQIIANYPDFSFDGIVYSIDSLVSGDLVSREHIENEDWNACWLLWTTSISIWMDSWWEFPPSTPNVSIPKEVRKNDFVNQMVIPYPTLIQDGSDFFVSCTICGVKTERATFGPEASAEDAWFDGLVWLADKIANFWDQPDAPANIAGVDRYVNCPCGVEIDQPIKNILGVLPKGITPHHFVQWIMIRGGVPFLVLEHHMSGKIDVPLTNKNFDSILEWINNKFEGVEPHRVAINGRLLIHCNEKSSEYYNGDYAKDATNVVERVPYGERVRMMYKFQGLERVYEFDERFVIIRGGIFVDYIPDEPCLGVKINRGKFIWSGMPEYSRYFCPVSYMLLDETPTEFRPNGIIRNGKLMMTGSYCVYGNQCRGMSYKKFHAMLTKRGQGDAQIKAEWAIYKAKKKDFVKIPKAGAKIKRSRQNKQRAVKNPASRPIRARGPYQRGSGDQLAIPIKNKAMEERFKMGKCAAMYGAYLINPFIVLGERPRYLEKLSKAYGGDMFKSLPCVPKYPALPSFKTVAMFRDDLLVGTAGTFFVAVAPFRIGSNYGSTNSRDQPIVASGQLYAGTDFPVLDGDAAVEVGVDLRNWQTNYLIANLVADKKYRVVCCGVKVLYTGKLLDESGLWHHFQDPTHQTLSEVTPAEFSTQSGYYTEPVTKNKWAKNVWCPVMPPEYDYKYDPIVGPDEPPQYVFESPQDTHHIGILGKGLEPGTSVRVEACAVFEVIGTTVVGKTANSSDSAGMDVLSTNINPDTARIIDNKPGMMEKLLNSADLSHIAENVVRGTVNYVAGYYGLPPLLSNTAYNQNRLTYPRTGVPQSVTVEEVDTDDEVELKSSKPVKTVVFHHKDSGQIEEDLRKQLGHDPTAEQIWAEEEKQERDFHAQEVKEGRDESRRRAVRETRKERAQEIASEPIDRSSATRGRGRSNNKYSRTSTGP